MKTIYRAPFNVFTRCKQSSCFQIDILDSSPVPEDVEYFEFSLRLVNDASQYAELVDTAGRVFIIPKRMYFISLLKSIARIKLVTFFLATKMMNSPRSSPLHKPMYS